MGEELHSDVKETAFTTVAQEGEQAEHHGTTQDAHDMHRLGKKQEFQVYSVVPALLPLER
jgi:hypothetical protein